MDYVFDLLEADEIDVRVGSVKAPKDDQPGGVTLLLYKDARCDMNRLDEIVGPFNWKREHSRDNANCTVYIWDDDKKEWIGKEDTGIASRTDGAKGIASDSFKRACVNWGIGRELYTAPIIWISGNPDKLKWGRYSVKSIGYDEKRQINALVIVDKYNRVVFKMGEIEEIEPDTPDDDKQMPKADSKAEVVKTDKLPVDKTANYIRNEISDIQEILGLKTYVEARKQVFEWADNLIKSKAVNPFEWIKITEDEAKNLFKAIRVTFIEVDKK